MNVISNAEYTKAHGKVHLKSTLQNHADVLQYIVWPLYKEKCQWPHQSPNLPGPLAIKTPLISSSSGS